MIKVDNIKTYGWDAAVKGMRNAKQSWDKSDSYFYDTFDSRQHPHLADFTIGEKDMELMKKLVKAGPDHSKFMRMIVISMNITAPLYWWKQLSTYKIGTVENSTSTMNSITDRELTIDDFSHEDLLTLDDPGASFNYDCFTPNPENTNEYIEGTVSLAGKELLELTVANLNTWRKRYNETGNKAYWRTIIQLLPDSYNQMRTVSMNYQTAQHIYNARNVHKLDEWRDFCNILKEKLPYFRELVVDNDSQ